MMRGGFRTLKVEGGGQQAAAERAGMPDGWQQHPDTAARYNQLSEHSREVQGVEEQHHVLALQLGRQSCDFKGAQQAACS